MAFDRPTLTEIISRLEADLVSRLGLDALLPRSVLKVLGRVEAGAAHLLHGHLEYVARQVLPDTADTEHLDRWASIFGLTRKAAAKARSIVTFTGVNGTQVPIGSEFVRADGERFRTTTLATMASGTGSASAEALQPYGEIQNSEPAITYTLAAPIAGIDDLITSSVGFSLGSDVETDELLRARLLKEIQTAPQGGAEIDYELWALEVSGVTRAWTLPLHFGVGSVGLTFVRDNDSGGLIPSAAEVQAVQDHIDPLRPVAVGLFTTFAPTAVPLAFTIDLTTLPSATDSADIQAAITANLTQLLLDEAAPGGSLAISKVREAISTAEGETDHILSTPSADVTVNAGELSTLGTITFV